MDAGLSSGTEPWMSRAMPIPGIFSLAVDCGEVLVMSGEGPGELGTEGWVLGYVKQHLLH